MQGERAMQEDLLGEVQELQPCSRPPSNNKNSTEYNDLNVPTLASKFEELIAALPPLPMPLPRPSPAVGRQGAKRRRKGADSLLLNNNCADKSLMIRQKIQQAHQEDETIYCSFVYHRIAVWLPAPSTTNTNAETPINKNKTPSTSLHKNGAYRFGRIIGQEDLPPYRQIIKYDTPIEGSECSYVNLKTETWVALCDDEVNKTPPPPPAPVLTTADERATPNSKYQEREITSEIKKARPLSFLSPEQSPPPPPPLKIENEYNLSVYSTTCGPAGYEIYALLPDTLRIEDIKVKCYARGKVDVKMKQSATPREKNTGSSFCGKDGGGEAQGEQAPEKELEMEPQRVYTVNMPSTIYPESARALFTSSGQLYIRVDSQEKKNIATGEKSGGKDPYRVNQVFNIKLGDP
jgi:hypothetical protein